MFGKSKKADVQSIFVMILILFMIGVVAIVFTRAFNDILPEIKAEINESSPSAEAAIEKVETQTPILLDYLFLAVFIGMSLGVIISSIYVDVHPAFIIVFILGWIMMVGIGAIIANVFTEITEEEELVATAVDFPFTIWIMHYFPILAFALGMLVIIVLYGKGKSPSSAVV